MPISSGKYKEEWERVKKTFTTVTKKKKPSESFMVFWRAKTGLANKFGIIDAAFNNMKVAKATKEKLRQLGKFQTALKNAKNAAKNYQKTLASEFEKEKKANKQASVMSTSIKVLQADIDAIITHAEGEYKIYSMTIGKTAREAAAAMRGYEVLTKVMEGAIKSAILFHRRNDRNATAGKDDAIDLFKSGIGDAARDITQNMGNLLKLYDSNSKETRACKSFYKALTTWAQGGMNAPDVKKIKHPIEMQVINDRFLEEVKKSAQWLKGLDAPAT
ncbi:MAG: hypothetical protein AAGA26_04180 [Pseudomonadota bacterium]